MMRLSRHAHATRYLAVVSFAESSFFPVPPDIMLLPMTLARPAQWFVLASVTTVSSVLGGVFGYLIGYLAFESIALPVLHSTGQMVKFTAVQDWFQQWGGLVVFLAGFSPIPYKIFTLTAGLLHMNLLLFIFASFIGRASRFFLLAKVVSLGGPALEHALVKHIDKIGWFTVLITFAIYALMNI